MMANLKHKIIPQEVLFYLCLCRKHNPHLPRDLVLVGPPHAQPVVQRGAHVVEDLEVAQALRNEHLQV